MKYILRLLVQDGTFYKLKETTESGTNFVSSRLIMATLTSPFSILRSENPILSLISLFPTPSHSGIRRRRSSFSAVFRRRPPLQSDMSIAVSVPTSSSLRPDSDSQLLLDSRNRTCCLFVFLLIIIGITEIFGLGWISFSVLIFVKFLSCNFFYSAFNRFSGLVFHEFVVK